jgi:hypothetical protein
VAGRGGRDRERGIICGMETDFEVVFQKLQKEIEKMTETRFDWKR